MKKLFTLLAFVCFAVATMQAKPIIDAATKEAFAIAQKSDVAPELLGGFTVESFTTMKAADIEAALGRKPKLKEIIALKAAQKKIKKATKNDKTGDKEQFIAVLLAGLIGTLGIHRFYLGYTGIGIIQLLTLGGCGIWALIDLIRLVMNTLPDVDGNDLIPWSTR